MELMYSIFTFHTSLRTSGCSPAGRRDAGQISTQLYFPGGACVRIPMRVSKVDPGVSGNGCRPQDLGAVGAG